MKTWVVIFFSFFLINIPLKSQNINKNYQSIKPAVVFIANTHNAFDWKFNCDQDSYYEYFRPIYEYFWPPQYFHGTGFLISSDGYIVTAAHVVSEATETLIVVENPHLKLFKAKLIGTDWRTDVAVLKIDISDESEFSYLTFGNSDMVEVGDTCRILGSPLSEEYRSSLTEGIISGKDRIYWRDGGVGGYFQIDTPVNGGNSGSPLFNEMGEVIGLLRGAMRHDWVEGMAFALASNTVQSIAMQLIEHGEIAEGYHGIEVEEDFESAFDVYYFDYNEGAMISSIEDGSPAQKAGLEVYDVIHEMNGKTVSSFDFFWNQIRLFQPGEEVHLKVRRGNEDLDFTFRLTANR